MPPRLLTKQNERFIFAKETGQVAPYAILSHTWGETEQELTYKDIIDGTGREKDGYAKLLFCAEQAAKDKLEHFWIDTCCINKDSETELSTAIRSMFTWYADSKVCYVYLEDVSLKRDRDGNDVWLDAFRGCRWFTRGWTLQELLAPQDVRFFARNQSVGTRDTLCQVIHEITGIEVEALNGRSLSEFDRERRIAWAVGRQTKVPEDVVYALMGICGVSMSPRYGEGVTLAKQRFERNIAKLYKPDAATQPGLAQGAQDLSESRKQKLKRLRFISMETRHNTIRRAIAKTCSWILEDPVYKSWISTDISNQHHGFLWIKGKPGAGKSVLMKYLHGHLRDTKREDDVLISFYFNARGEDLEKSMKGMYRSLLVQLLVAVPHLQSVLDAEIDLDKMENVRHLLLTVVLKLKRVWILIDALDECQDQEVQQMVDHFRDLGLDALDRQVELRVGFASRHYPTVEVPTGLSLVLESLSNHTTDLDNYINSSLRIGTSQQAERLKRDIRDKANGVFLWTVLVVDILNKEYRNGRVHDMHRRVKEIPQDLHDLFTSILRRYNDDNMNECALCFTLILFAKRPLELREFYFGMMTALAQGTTMQPSEVNEDEMHSFLISSSKGLAELTAGRHRTTAQFVHESVRDHLLAGGLWSISQRPGSTFEAHEMLMNLCWSACQVTKALDESRRDTGPFLKYAINNVLWHAEHASSTSQAAFLSRCEMDVWRKLLALSRLDSELSSNDLTLAYLCAILDLPKLITTLAGLGEDLHRETGQVFGCALLAAFHSRSWAAARAILAADAAVDPDLIVDQARVVNEKNHDRSEDRYYGDDYGHILRPVELPSYYHSMFVKRPNESVWSFAFRSGLPALGMHFIHRSNAHILSATQDADTAFEAACLCGSVEGLRAALDVNPNLLDIELSSGWTALRVCAKYGHTSLTQVLIDLGASMNLASGYFFLTPLETAAYEGRIDICRILIEAGANLGRAGGCESSALLAAARAGQKEVCELLIDAGADIEAKDLDGYNALMQATRDKRLEQCKLLIALGADPGSCTRDGDTALHLAACGGSTEVCQYLINTALDLELRNHAGNTALHELMANTEHFPDSAVACLTTMLEAGANTQAKNAQGKTPLHCTRQEQCIEMLLRHGADVDASDEDGWTPLHYAVTDTSNAERILSLVRKGARVDAKRSDGMTPLHLFLEHDRSKYVFSRGTWKECLAELSREFNFHMQDKLGRTAMHLAAQNRHFWAIEMLLSRKASVDVADVNGQTPMDLMQLWNMNDEQAQRCAKLMMESKPSD